MRKRLKMKKIMVTRTSMPDYEEYVEAIKPLWESHWLTNMGKFHQELECELTDYLGVQHISLFCNGHLALELGLQALNLEGEVITTPFTFASTTHAIVRNGLKPVFCDIDPETYTIDVNKIEEKITKTTCAIIPVHVYGNICNVEEIDRIAQKYRLKVIYDAAHAFGVEYKGTSVGNFGDMSMFSFHATKVFNTIEGGAIIYSDPKLEKRLYQLKNFGIRDEDTVDAVGSNAKMNEFQAIMGLCNLKHINRELTKREHIVKKYRECLSEVSGVKLCKEQKDVKQNYAYFPILIDPENFGKTRDEVYERLKEKGIYSRKYFYPLTNSFDCYRTQFSEDDTPIAKEISRKVLTLPLYAELSLEDVEKICLEICNIQQS